MDPFSPPAAWFWWTSVPHPGSLCGRGWTRLSLKGFIRINKLKETIIYFYPLSVNYNNRSSAVGNDMIAETAFIADGERQYKN